MGARAIAAAAFAWVCAVAPAARAGDVAGARTVVVVPNETELVRALRLVLAPWGMHVVATTGPGPGATMPGSAERGRAVARAHRAVATVWVSSSEDGFALWVYDRVHDRALTRRLAAGPPFDDVTAAAIALSVKAMLQLGPLASDRARPEVHRVGDATRSRGVDVELGVGARVGRSGEIEAEPRLSLAALASFRVGRARLALGIAAQVGTGSSVSHPAFEGRLHDVDLAFVARLVLWRRGPVAMLAYAGAGASYSWLTVRPRDGRALEATRLNPLVTTALEAHAALTERVYLGLRVGGTFLLRFQRYSVEGQPILELSPAAGDAAILVGLRL